MEQVVVTFVEWLETVQGITWEEFDEAYSTADGQGKALYEEYSAEMDAIEASIGARFIFLDDMGSEVDWEDFKTAEEAEKAAGIAWDRLSDYDKRRRDFFGVIESANPDPEAPDHLDGDIVKEWRAEA